MTDLRDKLPVELIALDNKSEEAAIGTSLAVGAVKRRDAADVVVGLGTSETQARRAISCLVAPEPGDTVLVATAGGCAFILAVLERKALQRVELSVSDPEATVTLVAAELEFAASRRILQTAPDIAIEATSLRLFSRSLSLVSTLLTFLADRMHSSFSHQHTVADQIATKARQRVTVVDGSDVQQIGILSQAVESTAAITADSAILTTRKDLRLDGERISMG